MLAQRGWNYTASSEVACPVLARSPASHDTEPYTTISQWLIDSGCTAHMTPDITDFTGELEEYHTAVETANGALVEVNRRGQVKIVIQDHFNPGKTINVYLNDTLYVPNLNRRLISVSEWNHCGGQILFLLDRCTLQVLNDRDEVVQEVDVPPIYAEEEVPDQLQQSLPARQVNVVKVPQQLLHSRLAHRSVSSLLLTQQANIWSDVAIVDENDDFCETCKLTTARKSNTGRGTLEDLAPLVPGMCVMIDIVHNPSKESITATTYFKYYLTRAKINSKK